MFLLISQQINTIRIESGSIYGYIPSGRIEQGRACKSYMKIQKRKKLNKYYIILPLLILFLYQNIHAIMTGSLFIFIEEMIDAGEAQETVTETAELGTDVIRVGIHDDIVGMGYYNEKTKLHYGLEVDLSRAIAEKLGYHKIHFVPVLAETRADALLNDEVDVVVATCTITDQPEKGTVFSQPYMKTHSKFMTVDSSRIDKLIDLDNKEMGVLKDSANIKQARDYLHKRNIRPIFETYESYDTLFEAFFEGDVDALCVDESITNMYRELSPYASYGLDVNFVDFEYGALLREGGAFENQVDEAIASLKEDGELDKITSKWRQH